MTFLYYYILENWFLFFGVATMCLQYGYYSKKCLFFNFWHKESPEKSGLFEISIFFLLSLWELELTFWYPEKPINRGSVYGSVAYVLYA